MKSLKSILEASILANIDDQLEAGDEEIKKQIEEFINRNYDISEKLTISDEPNKDGKYEVSVKSNVKIINHKIMSLTNDYFVWKKVNGNFNCSHCEKLTSLNGAPEEVGGSFYCSCCSSLKSLEGAPKKVQGEFRCNNTALISLKGAPEEVGGKFDCSYCKNLIALEGAPEKIDGFFCCADCHKLLSLYGAPKKVKGSFGCHYCVSLKSLECAPKEVGGDFYCYNCKVQFTEEYVNKVSKVKGEIYCK